MFLSGCEQCYAKDYVLNRLMLGNFCRISLRPASIKFVLTKRFLLVCSRRARLEQLHEFNDVVHGLPKCNRNGSIYQGIQLEKGLNYFARLWQLSSSPSDSFGLQNPILLKICEQGIHKPRILMKSSTGRERGRPNHQRT